MPSQNHTLAGVSHALLIAGLAGTALATPALAQQWTVINLHPAGATSSEARAVDGGQQGGVINPNMANGAAVIWSGSASSMRSLNPVVSGQPSTGVSSALGAYGIGGCVFGGRQGGTVSLQVP